MELAFFDAFFINCSVYKGIIMQIIMQECESEYDSDNVVVFFSKTTSYTRYVRKF